MKNLNRPLRKDIRYMRVQVYEALDNCFTIKIQGKVDTDVNDQVYEQLFRPVLNQIKNEKYG